MATNSELIGYILAGILVLLILFSQPTLVGGDICGGKGFINGSDGICSCINGYYGRTCNLKYCPFGEAWYATPVSNHTRNRALVECSNMGDCDTTIGNCNCRDGYEGRACERWSCPQSETDSGFNLYTADLSNFPIQGVTVEGYIDTAKTTGGTSLPTQPTTGRYNLVLYSNKPSVPILTACGGKGVCRTMREMAAGFNGVSNVQPAVSYINWDADKIQGCLCDVGWAGYACDKRVCPFGRDPTEVLGTGTVQNRNEEYVLQCQAGGGYFSIFIRGAYTQPIPHDADPAYLKYALESVEGVGRVNVSMKAIGVDGLPSVCVSGQVASTSIWLTDTIGPVGPMGLTTSTSDTRMWRSGGAALALNSGTPILHMATEYTVVCPILCPTCSIHTVVFFKYGRSVSPPLNVTGSEHSLIKAAILGLADLANSDWPGLSVNITGMGGFRSLCDVSKVLAVTTLITLTSSYSSIPSLEIVSSSNLTMTSTAGSGTMYECSNQGVCDGDTGTCVCESLLSQGEIQYQAVSSNGRGGLGNRGDCGYLLVRPSSCWLGASWQTCSGHGQCTNSTGVCTCFDGWAGMNCGVTECPKGPAWFDEAISSSEAHRPAECSNVGTCNRESGICTCRAGFVGKACEIYDCPRNQATGDPCAGLGECMTLSDIFEMHGLVYGQGENSNLRPSEWDGDRFRSCVCAVKTSGGYQGLLSPSVTGPQTLVSGYSTGSPPLPGYSGYGCHLRNCPKGDARSVRHGYGVLEIQRVVCSTNVSANVSFHLNIFGQRSNAIHGNMGIEEIKAALEYPSTVGNVSVIFPHYEDYFPSSTDTVLTACASNLNTTFGGFLVEFLTELGDLPLLTVSASSHNSTTIVITEYQKGTNSNLECGGPDLGVCNRATGRCLCYPGQSSSNGTSGIGPLGDCAYYDPNPQDN